MSITEKQRQQQAELHKKLWSIANDLRGNMDASEFRNYILGLIFYRFLSEKAEQEYADALSGEDITYQEAWADEEYREDLKAELIDQVGYFIEPQDLFSAMIREIETQDFDIEHLATAIRKVETSTLGEESENDFIGLFSDMDLSSTRLGNNVKERTALISKVMVNKYLRYWRRLSQTVKINYVTCMTQHVVQVHCCYVLVKKRKCIVISDKNVTILHTT
ncbi:Type I restriction-modification system,DNA-methyltransferase subunit M [Staphylococcus aureus]|nr:Type I restriction-modification system,DNA-methyltransferase subunit M [Staphylococcus aureus]